MMIDFDGRAALIYPFNIIIRLAKRHAVHTKHT